MDVRYAIIDKISTIRVRCNKILPATYGESLSYMEAIAKLAYKVNETIVAVNGLNDNVDALNDAVIEFGTRLSAVEGEIDGFEQEVNNRFDQLEVQINASVDAKLAEVDTAIAGIDSKLESVVEEQQRFENDVNSRITTLEHTLTNIINDELAYLNEMYSRLAGELRNYIEEKVDEAISDIPDLTNIYVIDPTTGILSKVNDAITNIFYFELVEALTIDEYNRLQLTVNELNDLMVDSIPRGFTIHEWLNRAKTWLVKQLDIARVEFLAYPHSAVWDYLAGKKVWHDRNVDINQMLVQISGGYSCGELDDMSITFGDIADADISCIDYVMKANMILT